MATIINNPSGGGDGSGLGVVVGILVGIVVVIIFFVYGLPAIRNRGTAGTPGIPGHVQVSTNPTVSY